MEVFMYLGLCIAVLIATFGVTGLLGWLYDDWGDYSAHWIVTCMLYAITVTLVVRGTR